MLIPLEDLLVAHHLRPTGILHVGAHLGEEAETYDALDINYVLWVEGNEDLIPELEDHVFALGQVVYHGMVSDVDGTATFNLSDYTMSSSLLEFGTHAKSSPQAHMVGTRTVQTWRLDHLIAEPDWYGLDFLNLDLQGAELLALKGLGDRIEQFDAVYTEVNKIEVYKGCARIEQIDDYLSERGFERTDTLWYVDAYGDHGWGDALYLRKPRP